MIPSVDSERFANIKRIGGDVAALRMLLAAQKQGAPAEAVVACAEDIELSATNLAKLRAVLGVKGEVSRAEKPARERRKRDRLIDRSRERKAVAALLRQENTTDGATMYVLGEEAAERATTLFESYFGARFSVDPDLHTLFLVRVVDEDEHLFLCTVEKTRPVAQRLTGALSAAEVSTRVHEEVFSELFPRAPSIDELAADELLPLLVGKGRAIDVH